MIVLVCVLVVGFMMIVLCWFGLKVWLIVLIGWYLCWFNVCLSCIVIILMFFSRFDVWLDWLVVLIVCCKLFVMFKMLLRSVIEVYLCDFFSLCCECLCRLFSFVLVWSYWFLEVFSFVWSFVIGLCVLVLFFFIVIDLVLNIKFFLGVEVVVLFLELLMELLLLMFVVFWVLLVVGLFLFIFFVLFMDLIFLSWYGILKGFCRIIVNWFRVIKCIFIVVCCEFLRLVVWVSCYFWF